MKNLMSFGLVLSFILGFSSAFAQDFAVPQNYRFNKKSDYAKYENHVIKAVDWLTSNSPTTRKNKRQEANAFLMKWLEGSPNVSITLYKEVIDLAGKNPDLLMVFMGSWAKKALESGKPSPEKKGMHAGVNSVLDYYSTYKGKGITKDRAVEIILKKRRKKQLDSWLNGFVKDDK